MRIRIRRPMAGIVDGVSLSHFAPGLAYDVSDSLGGYLVSTGDADALPTSATTIEPQEEPSDSSLFGGIVVSHPPESVVVSNPREIAADRPRRARRPRKRR